MIVFDIDGTILPETSCEKLFVRYLIKQKILRFPHACNFSIRALALLPNGIYYTTKANKGYLRNFDVAELTAIGKSFFESHVKNRISPRGLKRVNEHTRSGDSVILLSGMPDFLLRNFSEYLKVPKAYGSIMEINISKFSGRTLGPFPLAQGKIEALKMIINGHYSADYFKAGRRKHNAHNAEIDWSTITFYGDHWLDRFLMFHVGNPIAVNPREKLRRLAIDKGWTIEIFGP